MGRHDVTASPATTARCLLIDVYAAEAATALEGAGLRPILLKGATVATWLYRQGDPRPYGDADLYVDPAARAPAIAALTAIGYRRAWPGADMGWVDPHADVLVRRDGALVDLHVGIWGIGAPLAVAWQVLTARRCAVEVGGRPIDALDLPGRALVAALHAAKHGAAEPVPVDDLARAVGLLDFGGWQAATDLARRLGAEAPMAAGLRLVAGGETLAARLHLPTRLANELRLQAASAPPLALTLERLRRAPSRAHALRFVATHLAPPPRHMRAVSSLARTGSAGLAAAYALRPLQLAARLPAAVRAHWRLSRAETGR